MRRITTMLTLAILALVFLLSCVQTVGGTTLSEDGYGYEHGALELTVPLSGTITAPAFGGSITLAMRSPLTLNPLLNEDETVDVILSLIFEKLFVQNEQMQALPNPALVQDYSISQDNRSITITLLNDIFWADGTRITAQDVAFSVDFLRTTAPAHAIYRSNVANIASATVVDNRTVRLNLHRADALIIYQLRFPIIPQAYYRNIGTTHQRQMVPLGNGPFRMYSFARGREMVLVASEHSNRLPAFIGTVNVRILDSSEDIITALANGVVDAAFQFEQGGITAAHRVNARIFEFATRRFDFVGFNFESGLAADIRFRQAVSHLIPYNQLVGSVYMGMARLAPTPVSPDSWLKDSTAAHADFDIERAAELFDDIDSYRAFAPRILVNEENRELVAVANFIANNMRRAGVYAELSILPWDEYMASLSGGGFDIFLGSYNLSAAPDFGFIFHSQAIGTTNILRYNSNSMNTLLAFVQNARATYERLIAMSELQHFIADDLPMIGLVFRTGALIVNGRIMGEIVDANEGFGNIQDWYINTREITNVTGQD